MSRKVADNRRRKINIKGLPSGKISEIDSSPLTWGEHHHETVDYLQENTKFLGGYEPAPIIGLGSTNARLWRYRNVPAYVHGLPPTGMGTYNKYVDIDAFLHVVRYHVLCAYDYLTHPGD